jgi:hypothetical protein
MHEARGGGNTESLTSIRGNANGRQNVDIVLVNRSTKGAQTARAVPWTHTVGHTHTIQSSVGAPYRHTVG